MTTSASSTASSEPTSGFRSGGVERRRGRDAGLPQRILDDDEVRDRHPPEDERRAGRPGVTAAHGQPGERHGLGGPRHRDRRRPQLHEGRDRQERDAGAGDEVAEEVLPPLAEQEPAAHEQVGERGERDRGATPGVEVAVEDDEDAPEQERGVGEDEDRARRPQVVAPDAHLLAGRGDDVHEPEAGQRDDRLGRVGVARQPAGQLRGRQHEGQRRQPAPRAEERDRRRCPPG